MASFSFTPIEPVEVEIRGVGLYAPASTVEQMITFLLSDWPDKKKAGVTARWRGRSMPW